MNIRFYSIPKDEFEGGDFVECQECGAHIRHVMEIDRVPYGCDCGARKAGWNVKRTKKVQRDLAYYTKMLNHFMAQERYTMAYSSGARPILGLLGLMREIPYTNDQEVCEIVAAIVN